MSDSSFVGEEEVTQVVFVAQAVESSEDPPMEEWSSLEFEEPEENIKKIQFEEGLYHPGSGEVCAKYIAMSDSDVLRHPYYNYPAVLDPGIEKALFCPEDKTIYADDGQELYLAICNETGEAPVRSFWRGLLTDVIDLRYYCISTKGARAMSLALCFNRHVKVLNLTDNFLSIDACYHLGEMLCNNSYLVDLNLSGCKIGHAGARQLLQGLTTNRTLKILNLDKNALTDQGMEYLATAVFRGMDVQEISLSYNGITGKGIDYLTEVFETYNNFTKINLSWNKLITPAGLYNFLTRLGENKFLTELDLSWNAIAAPRLATGIKNACNAPNLRYLNLRNNRLTGEAITKLLPGLNKAKELVTLDLSFNPITPEDAKKILTKAAASNVSVQKIYMENVLVDQEFIDMLRTAKVTPSVMKLKANFDITYEGVLREFQPVGVDMRDLLLTRADFLGSKRKKAPMDIALMLMTMLKTKGAVLPVKQFFFTMIRSGAPLDYELLEEMARAFAGPKQEKTTTIDLKLVVDYINRKWPERQLPPTPPPPPEPVKKKRKGKGKK